MGLIEDLRKRLQGENANKYILRVQVEFNGNMQDLIAEIQKPTKEKKEVRKNA